jgi:hypothetical protein
MRRLCLMLLAAAGLLALPAMGQEPTPQAPQKKATIVHTDDGGVTEVLQSIVVPPKAGAPFTLTLVREEAEHQQENVPPRRPSNSATVITRNSPRSSAGSPGANAGI